MCHFLVAILFFIQPIYPANFIEGLATKHRADDIYIVIPILDKRKTVNICTQNNYLYKYIYKPTFKRSYPDFARFLNLVLAKKLSIQRQQVPNLLFWPIDPTSELLKYYQEKGFDIFKKKYLRSENGHFVSRSGLPYRISRNERLNLYKIMFEHGYYGGTDDYSGEDVFYEPEQLG